MESTTIKVSRELRDRLAAIARAEGTTLAGAIEKALDANSDAEFWAQVARTMGGQRAAIVAEAESEAGTLMDGLDPDEDWSDVW